ncbi:MAG: hypothetical protein WCL49_09775 [bacterium]
MASARVPVSPMVRREPGQMESLPFLKDFLLEGEPPVSRVPVEQLAPSPRAFPPRQARAQE